MKNNDFLEPFIEERVVNSYTVYFDEDIIEPSYYRVVCEILRKASPDDEFTFMFNTGGGSMSGMDSLLSSMRACQASIHGVLVGEAASAGSALFLGCNSFEVGTRSSMMIHTASYGIGGKHTDIVSYIKSSVCQVEDFIDEVYKDFLPSKLLDEVKRGDDVYLDSSQIKEYLISMCNIRDEKSKGLMECENTLIH